MKSHHNVYVNLRNFKFTIMSGQIILEQSLVDKKTESSLFSILCRYPFTPAKWQEAYFQLDRAIPIYRDASSVLTLPARSREVRILTVSVSIRVAPESQKALSSDRAFSFQEYVS
jgi:hypothetical protein